MKASLKVSDLSLRLDDKLLLSDIHFDLPLGQVLFIIGESGSGKTLLTKLLLGQKPKKAKIEGSITYDELDLLHLPEKSWQDLRGRKLAYMVQNPMAMFNPFQKIKSHFLETIQSHSELSKEQCLQKALTAMKQVRLGHQEKLLESYPFELSGGMLQRVMLAILLCLEPEILILDEPTSALDAYNRDNIIRILQDLKKRGKTLIIVTHDYELARALGGQMLVMYGGELVEKGETQELLEHPQAPYSQTLILGNPYERLVDDD